MFVDGYFVGEVDSFDGSFQRLHDRRRRHKVEIKADGYEPLQFDVLITPGETVTYKGDMKPEFGRMLGPDRSSPRSSTFGCPKSSNLSVNGRPHAWSRYLRSRRYRGYIGVGRS